MRKTLLSCLAAVSLLFAGTLPGFALEQDEQGVYQITTVDDLLDFADAVNGGEEASANAVLTADLDLDGKLYFPVGNVEHPYTGTFDGQGHVISNLYIDADELGFDEYLGFFGVLANGAHIKNLIIGGGLNAFIGGKRFIGGIAGGTNGKGKVTIENCGNEAWIFASEENAAGILGVDMLSEADVTILNCYNTGEIQGSKECAAICGWIGDRGVCKGCWNTFDFEGGNGADQGRPFCRYNGCEFDNNWDVQGKQTDAGIGVINAQDLAGMATGEFCYKVLNQTLTEDVAWFQTIGADEHPVPFASHGVVYVVGDMNCDGSSKGGETTYSNNASGSRDPHVFENGACTVCDEWDPSYLTAGEDDFYTLASDADLYWYIRLVNQKEQNTHSARLAADINYTHQARLGDAFEFKGTFDGQNHTVTFAFAGDADKLAFIKNMRDAVVENVILKGSIASSTHFSAGVVSEAYGTSYITNVVADVDITSSFEGDGTHGGLVAVGHDDLTVENCAYVGTLTCPVSFGTGGIVGWSGDGQRMKILNCYVGGTLDMKTGSNNIVIGRNNPYIEDCWVSNVNEGLYDNNSFTTFFDAETLSTGEFCYKDLNGTETSNVAWFQTLDKDAYPVPFSTHGTVYVAGAQTCDGTPKGDTTGFSNDPAGDRDPHAFVDGFCSVCHAVDADYKTADAEGFYALATSHDLEWFIAYTKTQETKNACAKLTADIDYTAQEAFGVVRCNYEGTFDGQGHTVKVAIKRGEDGRAALFDLVENATIQNLVVEGTIESEGHFAAGLVVEAFGSSVIKNVVVKADITSEYIGDGTNGGIVAIGYDDLVLENCAFVGTLAAELCDGNGGLIAYTHGGDKTTIKNSYVSGELYFGEGNNDAFARNTSSLENVWTNDDATIYLNVINEDYLFDADMLKSGELCYRLGNKAWFQTLGTDAYPVPFATHSTVYAHGTIDCSGEGDLTYDNVEGAPTYENHNFVDGECVGCHNAYQITTAQGMEDLAYDVAGGEKVDAYIELAADVDLTEVEFFAIGSRSDEDGYAFQGHFNGNGHTVNLVIDKPEANNQGLFGVVADGAVIENVIVTGSINAKGYAAGIVGATTGSGKVVIKNCGNEADVTVAEANAAGILGVDDLGAMAVTITNCYTTGAIVGARESAAICGWMGNNGSSINNTWSSSTVAGLDGGNTFFRNGSAKAVNCYETAGTQVTQVTADQVANGELCAMLNKGAGETIWFQADDDTHPVLDPSHASDGIENIYIVAASAEAIYNANGMKVSNLQKGLNIVKMVDGSVRKVLVK